MILNKEYIQQTPSKWGGGVGFTTGRTGIDVNVSETLHVSKVDILLNMSTSIILTTILTARSTQDPWT